MSDPGGKNAWLTPENLPSGTRTLTVPVPDDLSWVAIFKGAVILLTNADNFEKVGGLEPAEVAERFMETFLDIGEDMIPIGTVLEFAGMSLPDGFLWCHGGTERIVDYPELYAVIGSSFDVPGTVPEGHFTMPDRRDRVGVGVNKLYSPFSAIGKSGGEKTHVLTANEMPSHTHVADSHVHSLPYTGIGGNGYQSYKLGSGQEGTTSINPAVTSLQNSGGNQAHNNLQPFLVFEYIIRAK